MNPKQWNYLLLFFGLFLGADVGIWLLYAVYLWFVGRL